MNHDLPEDYEGEGGPERRPDDDRFYPECYGDPSDEDVHQRPDREGAAGLDAAVEIMQAEAEQERC